MESSIKMRATACDGSKPLPLTVTMLLLLVAETVNVPATCAWAEENNVIAIRLKIAAKITAFFVILDIFFSPPLHLKRCSK